MTLIVGKAQKQEVWLPELVEKTGCRLPGGHYQGIKDVLKLMLVAAAQLCEYTKNH